MSYVLDALRKSEQERQLASGTNAGVLFPVMVENRTPLVPKLLLVTAVLVIAALAAWWLWPRHPVAVVTRLSSNATPPTTVATTTSAASPGRLPPLPAALPRADRAYVAAVAGPTRPAGAAVQKASALAEKPASGTTASGERNADAPGELPRALLLELPPLAISGYINDDQAGSMAMVNDKLVREGEEVSPGLRLEKILADGALFSYKGYHFRR